MTDLAEELRQTLDAAHDTAVRALRHADERADRVRRRAERQSARAALALESAAAELSELAAMLRAGDPLDGLEAEIVASRLSPPPPPPPPVPRTPAGRGRTGRRASLRDSPLADLMADTSGAPAAAEPEPEPAQAPEPEPAQAPVEPDPLLTVRGRPGFLATWGKRAGITPDEPSDPGRSASSSP